MRRILCSAEYSPFADGMDAAGQNSAAGNALLLLNRMSGSGLQYTADKTDVHCLTTQNARTLRVLLWRDGRSGSGNILLRLRNLGMALRGAANVRVRRLSLAGTPDLTANAPTDNLEIPLVLGSDGVALLEITPQAPAPLTLTLTASQFRWRPGEDIRLRVTVQNTSRNILTPVLDLQSSFPGLVSADIARSALGKLDPGKSTMLGYVLPVPPLLQERDLFFNITAGEAGRAGIQVRALPALAITLETPRLDLTRPGTRETLANASGKPQSVPTAFEHKHGTIGLTARRSGGAMRRDCW